jgi:hypothetical protein
VAGTARWEATEQDDPGRGADARAVIAPVVEGVSGGLAWGATRVSIKKTGNKANLVLVSKQVQPQENPGLPHKIEQEFKVWPIG